MKEFAYRVNVNWDTEASVWVATSEDIPGLATEGVSMESLTNNLRTIIPELLQANGCISGNQPYEISFKIVSHRLESVQVGS